MSRRVTVGAVAIMALLSIFVVASFAAAEYTARPSSCADCHEMEPYYTSWQQSTHRDVPCGDCHVPPGWQNYLETKAFALREVYVHVTQQVKPPLTVTRDIPDASCLQCHELPPPAELPTSSFDHASHSEAGCIECHVRMVHEQVSPAATPDPSAMEGCLTCHDGGEADDACDLCHFSPHEPMGACDTCHSLDTWLPAELDHPFPLTGGHADLACGTCHQTAGSGATATLGDAPERCVACHGDEHGGLPECQECHSTAGWEPAEFSHPYVGEHNPSRMSCAQCHPNGYGSYSCSSCHSGTPSDD